jgi:hypothetical protein
MSRLLVVDHQYTSQQTELIGVAQSRFSHRILVASKNSPRGARPPLNRLTSHQDE